MSIPPPPHTHAHTYIHTYIVNVKKYAPDGGFDISEITAQNAMVALTIKVGKV